MHAHDKPKDKKKKRDTSEAFDLEELEKLKEGLDIQAEEINHLKDGNNLDIGDDDDINDCDLNLMIIKLRKLIERKKAELEGEEYNSDGESNQSDSDSDDEERKRKEKEAKKRAE